MVYLLARKNGNGCRYGVVINIIHVSYYDYSVNEMLWPVLAPL